MKIIIADDENRARQGVMNIIEKRRPWHELTGVSNGTSALELLKTGRHDLLITDIKMPGMDGLTLTEQAKKASPDTSVVILSAYGYFSYAQKALKAGASDYLLKPFTDTALLEIVDAVGAIKEQREPPEESGGLPDPRAAYETPFLDDIKADLFAAARANDGEGIKRSLSAAVMGGCDLSLAQCREMLVFWLEEFMTSSNNVLPWKFSISHVSRDFAEKNSARALFDSAEQVFTALGKNMTTLPQNRNDLLIELCMEYIKEHYQDAGLSPAEIASHFHFNTAYYSNLFKKHTGHSLTQYLLDFRLNKAKEMLFTTELKVYEIANAVGFNDDKYFIRVFAKEIGMPPKAFRAVGYGGT
ncbi:hypothetical protein FACS1894191_0550 [Clostridia bacterium]|nr:hypothetical protein FACS1894191_0550 [Clostridia bacterium]